MPQKVQISPDEIEAFFAQSRRKRYRPNMLDCLRNMQPWKFLRFQDFTAKPENFTGRVRRWAVEESKRQGKDLGVHILVEEDESVTICLYPMTPDEAKLRREMQARGFHMRKVVEARQKLNEDADKEDPESGSTEVSPGLAESGESGFSL